MDWKPPIIAICAGSITVILSINGALSGIGRAQGAFFWGDGTARGILAFDRSIHPVCVVRIWKKNLDADTATFALLVSLLICVWFQFQLLNPVESAQSFSLRSLRKHLNQKHIKASFDLMILNAAGLILVSLDVAAAGILLGSDAAAQYFPANRIAILVIYFQVSLNLAIAPQLSREFAKGHPEKALVLCQNATKLAFVLGASVLTLIVFSQQLLPLAFGTATKTTWLAAVILATGHLGAIATGFGSTALVAAGHEKPLRNLMLWSIPLSLAALISAGLWGDIIIVAGVVAVASIIRGLVVARICQTLIGGRAAIV